MDNEGEAVRFMMEQLLQKGPMSGKMLAGYVSQTSETVWNTVGKSPQAVINFVKHHPSLFTLGKEGKINLSEFAATPEEQARQFLVSLLRENGAMDIQSIVGHLFDANVYIKQATGFNVVGLTNFLMEYPVLFHISGTSVFRTTKVLTDIISGFRFDDFHAVALTVLDIFLRNGLYNASIADLYNDICKCVCWDEEPIDIGGLSRALSRWPMFEINMNANVTLLPHMLQSRVLLELFICALLEVQDKMTQVDVLVEILPFRITRMLGIEDLESLSRFLECKRFLCVKHYVGLAYDTETQALKYLVDCLHSKGSTRVQKITGHLSQAPTHIRDQIGKLQELEAFLKDYPDVFCVKSGIASLHTDANIASMQVSQKPGKTPKRNEVFIGTVCHICPKYGTIVSEGKLSGEEIYFTSNRCRFMKSGEDISKYLRKGESLSFNVTKGRPGSKYKWAAVNVTKHHGKALKNGKLESQKYEPLLATAKSASYKCDSSLPTGKDTKQNQPTYKGTVKMLYQPFGTVVISGGPLSNEEVYFNNRSCTFVPNGGDLTKHIKIGQLLYFEIERGKDGAKYKWMACNVCLFPKSVPLQNKNDQEVTSPTFVKHISKEDEEYEFILVKHTALQLLSAEEMSLKDLLVTLREVVPGKRKKSLTEETLLKVLSGYNIFRIGKKNVCLSVQPEVGHVTHIGTYFSLIRTPNMSLPVYYHDSAVHTPPEQHITNELDYQLKVNSNVKYLAVKVTSGPKPHLQVRAVLVIPATGPNMKRQQAQLNKLLNLTGSNISKSFADQTLSYSTSSLNSNPSIESGPDPVRNRPEKKPTKSKAETSGSKASKPVSLAASSTNRKEFGSTSSLNSNASSVAEDDVQTQLDILRIVILRLLPHTRMTIKKLFKALQNALPVSSLPESESDLRTELRRYNLFSIDDKAVTLKVKPISGHVTKTIWNNRGFIGNTSVKKDAYYKKEAIWKPSEASDKSKEINISEKTEVMFFAVNVDFLSEKVQGKRIAPLRTVLLWPKNGPGPSVDAHVKRIDAMSTKSNQILIDFDTSVKPINDPSRDKDISDLLIDLEFPDTTENSSSVSDAKKYSDLTSDGSDAVDSMQKIESQSLSDMEGLFDYSATDEPEVLKLIICQILAQGHITLRHLTEVLQQRLSGDASSEGLGGSASQQFLSKYGIFNQTGDIVMLSVSPKNGYISQLSESNEGFIGKLQGEKDVYFERSAIHGAEDEPIVIGLEVNYIDLPNEVSPSLLDDRHSQYREAVLLWPKNSLFQNKPEKGTFGNKAFTRILDPSVDVGLLVWLFTKLAGHKSMSRLVLSACPCLPDYARNMLNDGDLCRLYTLLHPSLLTLEDDGVMLSLPNMPADASVLSRQNGKVAAVSGAFAIVESSKGKILISRKSFFHCENTTLKRREIEEDQLESVLHIGDEVECLSIDYQAHRHLDLDVERADMEAVLSWSVKHEPLRMISAEDEKHLLDYQVTESSEGSAAHEAKLLQDVPYDICLSTLLTVYAACLQKDGTSVQDVLQVLEQENKSSHSHTVLDSEDDLCTFLSIHNHMFEVKAGKIDLVGKFRPSDIIVKTMGRVYLLESGYIFFRTDKAPFRTICCHEASLCNTGINQGVSFGDRINLIATAPQESPSTWHVLIAWPCGTADSTEPCSIMFRSNGSPAKSDTNLKSSSEEISLIDISSEINTKQSESLTPEYPELADKGQKEYKSHSGKLLPDDIEVALECFDDEVSQREDAPDHNSSSQDTAIMIDDSVLSDFFSGLNVNVNEFFGKDTKFQRRTSWLNATPGLDNEANDSKTSEETEERQTCKVGDDGKGSVHEHRLFQKLHEGGWKRIDKDKAAFDDFQESFLEIKTCDMSCQTDPEGLPSCSKGSQTERSTESDTASQTLSTGHVIITKYC